MAEKRKLQAEMDKCYKKIDEGVELFEEIMAKMQEANSENQREKFQDDLKKEIKKLQRLREQIKGWQNSSDIKDKEKLTHYRKVIEQRMEQFKDIERENKTKPHSKQGLSAEEKLDPREKEKSETIEWLQSQIRHLEDEIDKTEAKIEVLGTNEPGKKRGKKDEPKKGDKEKKIEDMKKHWDRMKFHISKLEVCMRLVNNETLESRTVIDALREPLEMYIDALDPENETDPDSLDPEDIYNDLDLGSYAPQLGTVTAIGTLDEENSNSISSPSSSPTPPVPLEDGTTPIAIAAVPTAQAASPAAVIGGNKQRHSSGEAGSLLVKSAVPPRSTPSTPLKLTAQASAESSSLSSPPPATPPPPPGMPYAVAASGLAAKAKPPFTVNVLKPMVSSPIAGGEPQPTALRAQSMPIAASSMSSSTTMPESPTPVSSMSSEPASTMSARDSSASPLRSASEITTIPVTRFPFTNGAHEQQSQVMSLKSIVTAQTTQPPAPVENRAQPAMQTQSTISIFPPGLSTLQGTNSSESSPSASLTSVTQQNSQPSVIGAVETNRVTSNSNTVPSWAQAAMDAVDFDLQVLRIGSADSQPRSREPQSANIPPWLGASPLGRVQSSSEHSQQAQMLDCALQRAPLQMDSERPRSYLPKMTCNTASYYPQTVPVSADSLEYYLRLSPETLFFTFYYMEGSRAQLLAAKALKKLSWRFHTKYLMWFQRHEEPKQITDDYEQGTYVYFDFEKWSQRKKEQFTFEYRYLEDKDFD